MGLSKSDISYNLEKVINSNYDNIDNSKEIIKYYTDKYSNFRTLTNKLSLTRKHLLNNGYNIKYLKDLYPDKQITKKVKSTNNDVLENTTSIVIKKKFVDELISEELNDKDCLGKVAYYLLLSSGRRIDEIMNSKFEKDDDHKHVKTNRILKKRNVTGMNKVRIIGCRDKFISALDKFKELTANILDVTIRLYVQSYIKEKRKDTNIKTSHFLRVLYANYLFKYENERNLIYNVFIKNVLNHSSLYSSINYSSIILED